MKLLKKVNALCRPSYLYLMISIVMGLLLYQGNNKNATANRFLAILLFFFAYRLSAETMANFGLLSYQNWTYHLFLEFDWIYGCLIFFYICRFQNAIQKILQSRLERYHLDVQA